MPAPRPYIAVVGRTIAARGWILLCGGRDAGVMDAAARGTREGGGLAIGMNPGTASEVALALRARNPTVLVRPSPETSGFFATIAREARFHVAGHAESAITWVSELIPLLTSGAP